MAAINSLLLLLTTTVAPDLYTSPPFWNDTTPTDLDGVLEPCVPFLRGEGAKECRANEHYEACGDICMKSCIEYECPLTCCVEGCFCDEGHVRGPEGTCVPEGECPIPFLDSNRIDEPARKVCGPDESIGCDSHCQRNCSNYHDVIACDDTCVLDCVCIPPKIRGPDGTCIHPQKCPAQTDPKSREDLLACHFIRMMNSEDPRCDKAAMPCNDPFGCPDDASEDFSESTQGMNRTRLRNEAEDGTLSPCFPSAELRGETACSGPNEHYEACGALCMETCFQYECPLKCCVEGCFCDEGFVRDPSAHTCVRREQCHALSSHHLGGAPMRCEEGEIPTCQSRCEKSCDDYRDENRKCPDECIMGCACQPPRVRTPEGDCVLPKFCPPTRETLLEEHMKMAATICNFVRIMGNPPAWSESCPMIVHECADTIDCFEENTTLPLLGQISICRKNEYLNVLPTCPVTCDNYREGSKGCKVTERVVPRCDCRKGLVRGPDGNCLPPENCPNQEDPSCPQIKCRSDCYLDNNHKPCPTCVCPNPDDEPCPLVRCEEDCYLDSSSSRCPTCVCPEVADPACPRIRCDQGCYYDTNNTRCPVCVCPRGPPCPQILCRKGYFLDTKARPCPKCIECPLVNCLRGCRLDTSKEPCPTCVCDQQTSRVECPDNEEYSVCGSLCPPTCSDRGPDRPCPAVCVPGCFCERPLIRGPRGHCIRKRDCPPQKDTSVQQTTP